MTESPIAIPKEFAQRLLGFEKALGKTDGENRAVFRVCEKLRGPLGKRLGIDGFRSLLARAQILAGADVSWILTLTIGADGSLDGPKAKLDARTVAEGEVVLVGHLLALLVLLVGPAVTLQLLHDVWPGWAITE
jgi:hypothetical protein